MILREKKVVGKQTRRKESERWGLEVGETKKRKKGGGKQRK